jgi:hypothetical protein
MSIEAMKQALQALEELWDTKSYWFQEVREDTLAKIEQSITTLRAAIQQAEETRYKLSCGCPSQYGGIPAEWATTDRDGSPAVEYGVICEKHWHEYDAQHPKVWQEPVAWIEWDDKRNKVSAGAYPIRFEDEMYELTDGASFKPLYTAPQPQQEQEPVAYVLRTLSSKSISDEIAPTGWSTFESKIEKLRADPWVQNGIAEIVPLYTSPQQREWQGLFFDAVYEAWHSAGMDVLGGDWNTFASKLEEKLKETK